MPDTKILIVDDVKIIIPALRVLLQLNLHY